MFDEIGEKIKGIAVFEFICGAILALVLAIGQWSQGSSYKGYDSEAVSGAFFWTGLLYLVAVSVTALMGACLIYGLGELIELTQSNNRYLKNLNEKMSRGEQLPGQGEAKYSSARPSLSARLNSSNGMDASDKTDWLCECGAKNHGGMSCKVCGKSR